MDLRTRALERAAADGDAEARWAAAVARSRAAGSSWSWRGAWGRFELAAYCRHEKARELLGRCCQAAGTEGTEDNFCWNMYDAWPLDMWVKGLAEYPHPVVVHAAVAAMRFGVPKWEGFHGILWWDSKQHYVHDIDSFAPVRKGLFEEPRRVLFAVEQWLACPCAEHLDRLCVEHLGQDPTSWTNALVSCALRSPSDQPGSAHWASIVALHAALKTASALSTSHSRTDSSPMGFSLQEEINGRAREAVREAVEKSLIELALDPAALA